MANLDGWKTSLLILALAIGGCASTPARQGAVETSNSPNEENTDPTAMHLHDVGGRLLLFCVKTNHLPAKLEDLEPIAGDDGKPSAIDPATGEAFIYTPGGIKPTGLPGRVIAYQSTTRNKGSRWVLLLDDRLMQTRVQRVADSLLLRPLE